MHAIRRQAHRTASRVGPGASNYNPFARVTSREQGDVESQVRRIRSEGSAQQTIEGQRRIDGHSVGQEFPPPAHADTAPSASPSSPTAVNDFARPANDAPITEPNGTVNKEFTDISDSTIVGENNSGVTKRSRFKTMFSKHGDKEKNAERNSSESEVLSMEERKKIAHQRKIPVGAQIRFVLFGSWINLLLIFVPIGFAVNYARLKPVPIFIINFVAIIPLAAMLSNATEELALRVGETFGGLLNATFGNAVELIVSIQALIKNEITIVKTSLIGSMLSNLLLVLGMSFFFGGINRLEQFFNVTVAQTAASLLALCIGSLIIPTVFHEMLASDSAPDGSRNQELSRGTAVILLIVYGCYLFFQLKSHVDMYNEPSQKVPKRKSSKVEDGSTSRRIAAIAAGPASSAIGGVNSAAVSKGLLGQTEEEEEEEFEAPQLTIIGALITLLLSTTMVAFCSEFMVDSINGVTSSGHISTTFVGLILLPIVGNAAEHATSVTVAIKDKMDLAIGVAVGSSMQIALLVLPLVVVLGWILGKECMTLYFDTFQIAVLFVAVLLVNYLIQDGKSHWLEGVLLMSSYLIISVAAWFYPDIQEQC